MSALSGFPPFFLVSIAAGMLTFPLMPFIILGFAGRLIRFAVAVFFPHWRMAATARVDWGMNLSSARRSLSAFR